MSTLGALSGGRVLVGLGLSGPQVVEGWHGVPYGKPAAHLREYVEILRRVSAREAPVSFAGQEYQLPYTGPGATGLGKPLKPILHTCQLPVYLAILGTLNVRTAAEIADGWLPAFFSPARMDLFRPVMAEGFARAGNGKSFGDFDIAAMCSVIVSDDVWGALATLKPQLALYIGGMGARDKNFYNELAVRYGYGEAAARIQDLYLAGRKDEAIAAVPDELADEVSLCGSVERIRERFRVWEDAGVTSLLITSRQRAALHLLSEIPGAAAGAVRAPRPAGD